jgi:hypothetical protein
VKGEEKEKSRTQKAAAKKKKRGRFVFSDIEGEEEISRLT